MEYGKVYIAIVYNKVVLLRYNLIGSVVEFSNGDICLQCEVAPISEFLVFGEL